jgi:alpha-1,3-glucanase-like protein
VLAVGGPAAQRGAAVPFVEYQAEAAATDGVVLQPSRTFGTLAAEASGRRAVRLQRGQYVEFTLRAPANAVDVRYGIPDAATGTLDVVAGGSRLAELALTSAYSWFYGGYPFTNDPTPAELITSTTTRARCSGRPSLRDRRSASWRPRPRSSISPTSSWLPRLPRSRPGRSP